MTDDRIFTVDGPHVLLFNPESGANEVIATGEVADALANAHAKIAELKAQLALARERWQHWETRYDERETWLKEAQAQSERRRQLFEMSDGRTNRLSDEIAEFEVVLTAVRQECDDLRAQRTRLIEMVAERDARLAEQNVRANERVADALKDRADMVDRAIAAEARAEVLRAALEEIRNGH